MISKPGSPASRTARYKSLQISTASQSKVIVMLHDRAVFLMSKSLLDRPPDRLVLDKAQNILVQLQIALKMEDEVSKGLNYIYVYCYDLLEVGSPEGIEICKELITPIKDAFQEALKDDW